MHAATASTWTRVLRRLVPVPAAAFRNSPEDTGRLARTTGGVGLRSAIKVVQDVLVEKAERKQALADAPLGTLATAVWFYDSLRQDIERSVRHASDGVSRTREAFRGSAIHENVAKAVAVMQVLEDFPLTAENLVALMLESVDAEPRQRIFARRWTIS